MSITNTTKKGQFINSMEKTNKIAQMISNIAMGDGKPNDFIDAYREIRQSERREDIEKVKDFQRKNMFRAGDYTMNYDQVMNGANPVDEPTAQITLPDVPNAQEKNDVLSKYMDSLDQAIQRKFAAADTEVA